MKDNVIPFSTVEAMAIAKAHGTIEREIKAVDQAILTLLATIVDEAENLEDEDVLDVWQMAEALNSMFDAVCRNPKDYDSFNTVQDFANTLDAYYQTNGDEDDCD